MSTTFCVYNIFLIKDKKARLVQGNRFFFFPKTNKLPLYSNIVTYQRHKNAKDNIANSHKSINIKRKRRYD